VLTDLATADSTVGHTHLYAWVAKICPRLISPKSSDPEVGF